MVHVRVHTAMCDWLPACSVVPHAVVDNSPCLAHFKANGLNASELKWVQLPETSGRHN